MDTDTQKTETVRDIIAEMRDERIVRIEDAAMPRERQEAYYIGGTTAKILKAVPPEQAAWLIQALMRWCLDGTLPDDAEISPECIGSWTAIVDESERIHAAREQQREAGRKGGESKRTPSEPEANAERKGTKKEKEINREINTETETEGGEAPQTPHSDSVSVSDSVSEDRSSKFSDLPDCDRRAMREDRPEKQDFLDLPEAGLVDAALRLVGEPGNGRMKGRLAKAKRNLGAVEFRNLLHTYASELEAGEVPANPGATLNAKLSAAEACLCLGRR